MRDNPRTGIRGFGSPFVDSLLPRPSAMIKHFMFGPLLFLSNRAVYRSPLISSMTPSGVGEYSSIYVSAGIELISPVNVHRMSEYGKKWIVCQTGDRHQIFQKSSRAA
jgi:hypothetical protein